MKSFARFYSPTSWLRRVFSCVGAMVLLIFLTGCPLTNDSKIELSVVGSDELANGEDNFSPTPPRLYPGRRFYSGRVLFAVVETTTDPRDGLGRLEFEVSGADGRAPNGVRMVIDGSFIVPAGTIARYFLIDETAPRRPVYVQARGTTRRGISVHSNRVPIYIHQNAGPAVPRITAVTAPDRIERGTQPTIMVTGVNLAGATIVMADAAGIAVLAQSVDTNTNTLTATLDVKTEAQTGFSAFHIATPAGGSTDHSLFIIEPRPLEIFGAYPNTSPSARRAR